MRFAISRLAFFGFVFVALSFCLLEIGIEAGTPSSIIPGAVTFALGILLLGASGILLTLEPFNNSNDENL